MIVFLNILKKLHRFFIITIQNIIVKIKFMAKFVEEFSSYAVRHLCSYSNTNYELKMKLLLTMRRIYSLIYVSQFEPFLSNTHYFISIAIYFR